MSVEHGAGDVAVVTGGGRGIGRAIAQTLADDGYRTVVWDIDADVAVVAAEEIRATGGTAIAVSGDVARVEQVRRAVDEVRAEFGGVDVLVNNAGFARHVPLLEITPEDWHAVVDTTLLGAFLCAQAVIPGMVDRGYGRIVNISSRTALGDPGQAPYVAAKAGLNGLTRALALELASSGITVNAVGPGLIRTDRVQGHANFAEMDRRSRERTWVKRDGTPEDVASAVAFFADRRNGFVTGEILYVARGRLAS